MPTPFLILKIPVISCLFLLQACGQAVSETSEGYGKAEPKKDSARNYAAVPVLKELRPYDSLIYTSVIELNAAPGTKSVLFNSNSSKLYAMNLEGMSVYEFDQPTKKVERIFKFKPTKGTGWNYAKDIPVPSFQEKPVEGCLSHNNEILWVSLHNAGGIVPIFLKHPAKEKFPNLIPDSTFKKIFVSNLLQKKNDSDWVPLIKTGKTPKIISKTADDHNLLVSNWHSNSISILEMDTSRLPFAFKLKDISVATIPRGIAVDDKIKKSYVAQMGGSELTVIDHNQWLADTPIQVSQNPRHLVLDTSGRIFVSFNKLNSIACFDASTRQKLFSTTTGSQPRTIILSKNYQFLFVTCYSNDLVQVFKIHKDRFEKITDLPCKGSPVGVDIYEDDEKLEAWVCKYVTGHISVYTFKKK